MNIPTYTLENYYNRKKLPGLPLIIQPLNKETLTNSGNIHKHDYFQIIFINKGTLENSIEYDSYTMNEGEISVIFPRQIHQIKFSQEIEGKIIMFDEALFCSDLLKKELKTYTVDLYRKLNYIRLDQLKYKNARRIADIITELDENLTPIRKEQLRFYLKILLLQLIEDAHEYALPRKDIFNVDVYSQFKELIEERYKEIKTVAEYAGLLGISTRKLNTICKAESGMNALAVIHERILVEVKRIFMFSGHTNKEIAYQLGFTSPSAFNKFIYAKTGKTPTELRKELA